MNTLLQIGLGLSVSFLAVWIIIIKLVGLMVRAIGKKKAEKTNKNIAD